VGVETVGLEPGKPIEVDDWMRAPGSDWLYAIGDVNGRALLTHMGKYQARVVGDALLGQGRTTATVSTGGVAVADRSAVPRVVFTDPEVAAVGPTERQAEERGIDVVAVRRDLADAAAAATRGEGVRGTCQLLVDPHREVLVGATFTGPDVGELLHAATVAIVGEVPLSRLAHVVASFPTMSEIWLRLLEAYPKSAKE
jgi:pyruvate/2-oxoglutarate dehydrogenase complex dihydrolipoamide dehydrogenase (E3) component